MRALVALGAVLAVAAPAHAAPNPFVGLVTEDAFASPGPYRDAVLAEIAATGTGTLRQTLDWSLVERRRRHFSWAHYDAWVLDCARHGLRVLPILFNPPRWASTKPRRHALRGTYRPRGTASYARFAREAVKRYGAGGSLWRKHPDVPAAPVATWQIWNEPNLPVYWRPRPNARQYVALLRAARKAIKKVDRRAQVITGGLPFSRLGIPLTRYVRQMYAARGRSAFDAIAINPYAKNASGVLANLRRVRKVMNARGDRRKGLWATEIGWSDTGPKGKFRLGPQGHATAISQTVPALWNARASLRLQGVIYFNWRDARPYPGGKDFWGLHTGLLDIKGDPKPAYDAFRQAVLALG